MKKVASFILLFVTIVVSAQNSNQFDANNKRHGVWKKSFDNTEVLRYEGEFFHGKEIGLFKFYKKINNRAVLTATKQFNKENSIADVKFLSSKGKVISEGKMNGKTYIGEWKYYHVKFKTLLNVEHYNDKGELEGDYKVYYINGQIAEERNYKNGKLQGISTWNSEKGVLLKTLFYKNDVLHGLAKHYDGSGELIVEGHYKNDKKHGIWKYYENGQLKSQKDFTTKSKNPYKKKQ